MQPAMIAAIVAEISYFISAGLRPEEAMSMALRHMKKGGHPQQNEPVVVGEQGPEIFVPAEPGTIVPSHRPDTAYSPLSTPENPPPDPRAPPMAKRGTYEIARPNIPGEMPGTSMGLAPRVGAWDQWLANLPESKNVQDLRTPQEKEQDFGSWKRSYRSK